MHAEARVFADRRDAGRRLGEQLLRHRHWADAVVLALPRGGVPVAFEVAQALHAPLDVMIVRKLGHPNSREFAIGAIASGGVVVMNERGAGGVSRSALDAVLQAERAELARREQRYRGGRSAAGLRGRDVVLVDDGLATGATMHAAVLALRQLAPARVTVAVPVGAAESVQRIEQVADQVVCLEQPEPFRAVGLWYRDFDQTSDEEVQRLLAESRRQPVGVHP